MQLIDALSVDVPDNGLQHRGRNVFLGVIIFVWVYHIRLYRVYVVLRGALVCMFHTRVV